MAEPSILKDHRSEAQIYIERVSIGAMVVALLFGLLLARIGYLQFVRYDAFVTRSDENRMQLVANAPSRGLIFDSEGNILACLLYTSPSPRDLSTSRMPSSA